MRRIAALLLSAGLLSAQQPETLLNDVDASVLNRDVTAAYDAAVRLDADVQALLRASRADVANQVLSWVPPAWESFVLDRRPFRIGDSGTPLTVPLASLRKGAGARVRTAAAAGTPSVPGSAAYFYFLESAMDARSLGTPDLQILGRPFWRADSGGDAWFTLARPDLLIVAGTRDLAAAILGRVLNGSITRALPSALPEWREIDRQAPLWGLRHTVDATGTRGITLSLDAGQRLEVRCLCSSLPSATPAAFQIAQPRAAYWILRAEASGDTSLAYALGLLGFGNTK